jgi:hypothetical protein
VVGRVVVGPVVDLVVGPVVDLVVIGFVIVVGMPGPHGTLAAWSQHLQSGLYLSPAGHLVTMGSIPVPLQSTMELLVTCAAFVRKLPVG